MEKSLRRCTDTFNMEHSAVSGDSIKCSNKHVMDSAGGTVNTPGDEKPKCGCCRRKVLRLERKIERLEELVQEKDEVIASLKAKNKRVMAELVENQLQKVCGYGVFNGLLHNF